MKYPDDYIGKVMEGDCLEAMKEMPDGCVDLVLTDPPYNAQSIGPDNRKYEDGKMKLVLKEYRKFCREWFKEAKRVSKCLVFSPGTRNVCYYPQPNWIICWSKPQAPSFSSLGGFNVWEPIMVYGKPASGKRVSRDLFRCDVHNWSVGLEKNHPCPKRISWAMWFIKRFSNEGDLVMDPMIGSGTTAVAAEGLSRKWIGIEKEPKYCEIARQRLSKVQSEMFT